MTMTDQANPMIWTTPKADCPDWCEEHCSETPEDLPAFEIHRRVLERHYFPAQIPTWPNGVRTLTVEQYEDTLYRQSARAELTFWPGKENETTQNLDAAELRELGRAAQRAADLLDQITEQ